MSGKKLSEFTKDEDDILQWPEADCDCECGEVEEDEIEVKW